MVIAAVVTAGNLVAQTQSEADYRKLGDVGSYKFDPSGHNEINDALERARRKASINAAKERIYKARKQERHANGKVGGAPVGSAPRSTVRYHSSQSTSGGGAREARDARRAEAVAQAEARGNELAAAGMTLVERLSHYSKKYDKTLSPDDQIMAQRGFRGNYVEEEETSSTNLKRDPLQGIIKQPCQRSIEELIAQYEEDEDGLTKEEYARLDAYYAQEVEKIEQSRQQSSEAPLNQ